MKSLLGLAVSFSVACATSAFAADLEKCYQKYGQVEETRTGGKKISVYKDQAEVAADCNAQALTEAEGAKDEAKIKSIASVVGKNSNWASSLPVYTVLAKRNPKAACVDENALYGLGDALARPGDEPIAKNAGAFLETCWPNGKQEFTKLFVTDNDYAKTNLCKFFKTKDAIPARRKNLCKKALANS